MRLDKARVKELYLKGYKYNVISKILKANEETVRKCIQRNFGGLKQTHDKNNLLLRFEAKEINKAINYEGTKFMSNKSIVLNNPSAYGSNAKGDLVLKKDKCFYGESENIEL
ncbi:DNA-binding response regulator [Clostridium sp. LP20]|uniref:DNA-binding response regulator n=1 Tax=Clostridium sp. LP20 TaxID=3418665 RepID=UPI003EE51A23